MLVCPLCEVKVSRLHPKSHILPNWMTCDILENRRAILVNRKASKAKSVQSGMWKTIVCAPCEVGFGPYDTYVSRVLTNRVPNAPEKKALKISRHPEAPQKLEVWSGLDFVRFHKFALSVALRFELMSRKLGDPKLDQGHIERMRASYVQSKAADENTYPLVISRLMADGRLGEIVTLPYVFTEEGPNSSQVVQFSGVGFLFKLYLSTQSRHDYVSMFKLKVSGDALVMIVPLRDTAMFRGIEEGVLRSSRQRNGLKKRK